MLTDDEEEDELMGGGMKEKTTRSKVKSEPKVRLRQRNDAESEGSDGEIDSVMKNNREVDEPQGEAENDSDDNF